MNITDSTMLYLTGYSVILGVGLAVVYGVFAFFRMLVSPVRPDTVRGRALCDIAAFITDVLYSLFAGVCVALLVFGVNSGRVRFAGLLGCAMGFGIYHFTLGRRIITFVGSCIATVRGAISFVYTRTVGRAVTAAQKAIIAILPRRRAKGRAVKKDKRKAENEKLEFLG